MTDDSKGRPHVDLLTMIGLTLLVGPLTTMAHELGGHGATCLALGGRLTEIGAFYVECEGTGPVARRVVAMAGAGMDAVIFGIVWLLWRRAQGDFTRLVLWLIFTVKGMVAAGYFLFSGVTGLGDWGPGDGGGIGPLPHPLLIRAALALIGLVAYIAMVRVAMRALKAMIGGGPDALPTQMRIALGFYITNGIAAVLAGLLNPMGLFITLASAAASSFGGTAGMFNIAYQRHAGEARPFHVARSIPLLIAGLVVVIAFAAILGPTLRP